MSSPPPSASNPPLTLNDCTISHLLKNSFQRHVISESDKTTKPADTLSSLLKSGSTIYYKIIFTDSQTTVCVINSRGVVFTYSSSPKFKPKLRNFLSTETLPKHLEHEYSISYTKKEWFDTTLTRKSDRSEDKKDDNANAEEDSLEYIAGSSIIKIDCSSKSSQHVTCVNVKSYNNSLPVLPTLPSSTYDVPEIPASCWVECYELVGGKELEELLGVRREEKGNFFRTGELGELAAECLIGIPVNLILTRRFTPRLVFRMEEEVG